MFRSITNIQILLDLFLLTKFNQEKTILNNKFKEEKTISNNKLKEEETILNIVTCSLNIKKFY